MKNRIIISGFLSAIILISSCKDKATDNHEGMAGMRLSDKEIVKEPVHKNLPLDALLKPTNEYVISGLPVVSLETSTEAIEVSALGTVQYDYRQAGVISSRISGRIENLYVKYRYQVIKKGEKVLDIYSPELVTSQQNYLFLLQNDPGNASLINAAKQRLILLGLTQGQLNQIAKSGKPIYSISVYSNYSGYVTDLPAASINAFPQTVQNDPGMITAATEELSLKEGAYLEVGQSIFNVINTDKAIVSLNISPGEQGLIKTGDPVVISAETAAINIRSTVSYIEPFYSGQTRSMLARVYINNRKSKLPIGSQVQATIFTKAEQIKWLPSTAVLSLGLNRVVFKKDGQLLRAHQVTTGLEKDGRIQILSGIDAKDSVVVNAQFLTENESFIQINE